VKDLIRTCAGTDDLLTIVLRGGATTRYHNEPTARQLVSDHTFRVLAILLHLWPDASRKLILATFYHDVAEGITGDLPAPFKRFCDGIEELETEIEAHLGLPTELEEPDRSRLKAADYLELCSYVRHQTHPRANVIYETGVRYINEIVDRLPPEDLVKVLNLLGRIAGRDLP
jgi:5'-deoxynucleotidase YfbR-like HD superfamily hydrolase